MRQEQVARRRVQRRDRDQYEAELPTEPAADTTDAADVIADIDAALDDEEEL